MLLYLGLFAFGLCFVLTPLLSRFLATRNLTDRPDGHRKLHPRAVPRLGGVAIFTAFVCSIVVGVLVSRSSLPHIRLDFLLRLAPALLIIFVLGLVDDLLSLPARHKLAVQVVASVIAVLGGIRFGANNDSSLAIILLQGLLTVFWLVLCANAFNLIDGMDGLATGLGLILALTLALGGWHAHHYQLLFVEVLFVGCLVGFLRHNFHPATIFLGDSGSLTIGFLLSALCVLWSNDQTNTIGKVAPVLAFAVPLSDVLCSIVRRFLAGRPIFSPDCDHIHHRLLRSGFSPRQSSVLFYIAATYASATAILCVLLPSPIGLIAMLAFGIAVLWCFGQLNYIEFKALGMAGRAFSLSRIVTANMVLIKFQETIRHSDDRLLFWMALRQACFDFGFDHVQLTLGDYVYEDNRLVSSVDGRTSLFFSICEDHSLALSGRFSPYLHQPAFGSFLEAVRDELRSRRNEPLQSVPVRTDLKLAESASVAASNPRVFSS